MTAYSEKLTEFVSRRTPDTRFNVLVALPADFREDEKLPMIVMLHGAGERGNDPKLITVNGFMACLSQGLPVRAVILAPQITDEETIWNEKTRELMELIEQTKEEYHADEERISLTGLSMGGYGTWEMGMRFPDYFSALAPICGGGVSWRAEKLKNVPVRAFHGDADLLVPVKNSYEMVDCVNAAGGKAELFIIHNGGHNVWDYAYLETNLLCWLTAQKRR